MLLLGWLALWASGVFKVKTPEGPPSLAKSGVPNATAADHSGFVPLFNRKDLSGWKTHPSQPGNWRVENGVLIGSDSSLSHLFTQRDDYQDFHLRADVRVNEGGIGGICFRARPPLNSLSADGYEAVISNPHRPRALKTGSLLVPGARALVAFHDKLVPSDQWFKFEVIAEGNHIVIKVDGKTTCDYQDNQRLFTSGIIALQQRNPRTKVEFRKIEIQELPPTKTELGSSGK